MAGHVSDFKKAPEEIIFDLINYDNPGKTISSAVMALGVPLAAAGQNPVANTTLEVTALPDSGYTGAVTVTYNRLPLDGFIAAAGIQGSLILPVGDAINYADLIPEINTALGINMTDADYVDGVIGEWAGVPNETKTIQIPASADSYVFLESLTVTMQAEDIPLSDVITVTTLSGLNYPEAPAAQG